LHEPFFEPEDLSAILARHNSLGILAGVCMASLEMAERSLETTNSGVETSSGTSFELLMLGKAWAEAL
jgi:hypothetical protein